MFWLLRSIRNKYKSLIGVCASRFKIYKILKTKNKIYLEIGSGDKKGKGGWLTLDLNPGSDIYCNLSRGIPFPDDSVAVIYSSHIFEHFTYQEGQKLFGECMRTLVPGGKFLIAVPNARLYIEAYISGVEMGHSSFFRCKSAYNDTTRIDFINYCAYMDGQHKYMFDKDNLLCILEKVGFVGVKERKFDDSVDRKDRDFESLYAEGIKPL